MLRSFLIFSATLSTMVAGLSTGPAAAESGLPVPRFVTVAASEANLRAGPGSRYPIRWVLVRPQIPVEVVGEFDVWRLVRDWEGVEGWIHQSLLTGRRTVRVAEPGVVDMHARPTGESRLIARVEGGVMGRLVACPAVDGSPGPWCLAELSGLRGWLPRTALWGVYAEEIVE